MDHHGSILESLGCICNALLSLNTESCYVLPAHAPPHSKRSSSSEKCTPPQEASCDTSPFESERKRSNNNKKKNKFCTNSVDSLMQKTSTVEPSKSGAAPISICCNSDFPLPVVVKDTSTGEVRLDQQCRGDMPVNENAALVITLASETVDEGCSGDTYGAVITDSTKDEINCNKGCCTNSCASGNTTRSNRTKTRRSIKAAVQMLLQAPFVRGRLEGQLDVQERNILRRQLLNDLRPT